MRWLPRSDELGLIVVRRGPLPGGLAAAWVLAFVLATAGAVMSSVPIAAQSDLTSAYLAERGVRPEEGDVERLYQAVFGRAPDQDGFDFWVIQRIEGMSLERVADFFIDSPEYRDRFGDPGTAGFVEQLYRNVLGRAPDDGGRMFWLDQLGDGMERRRLVVLFSESPEFVELTNTVAPGYADGRPAFSVRRDAVTEADLGESWREGCPIGPSDLIHLDLSHVAADGSVRQGRITVHREVADDVTAFFAELYRQRMPITSILPAADFAGDDDAMMAVNNTSGFNCRPVVGGSRWSRHAFGRAIDINPLVNPYVNGAIVLPPNGQPWVDRTIYEPGMLRVGDGLVTMVRSSAGWRWGGDWFTLKDYQHIDVNTS